LRAKDRNTSNKVFRLLGFLLCGLSNVVWVSSQNHKAAAQSLFASTEIRLHSGISSPETEVSTVGRQFTEDLEAHVSNNGPNERMPTLKLKKTLTATMKRRLLRAKHIEKTTEGLYSRGRLEQDRLPSTR
jgi:hypothetical protein